MLKVAVVLSLLLFGFAVALPVSKDGEKNVLGDGNAEKNSILEPPEGPEGDEPDDEDEEVHGPAADEGKGKGLPEKPGDSQHELTKPEDSQHEPDDEDEEVHGPAADEGKGKGLPEKPGDSQHEPTKPEDNKDKAHSSDKSKEEDHDDTIPPVSKDTSLKENKPKGATEDKEKQTKDESSDKKPETKGDDQQKNKEDENKPAGKKGDQDQDQDQKGGIETENKMGNENSMNSPQPANLQHGTNGGPNWNGVGPAQQNWNNRGGPAQQNWNNREGQPQQNWNNRGGPAQQNWYNRGGPAQQNWNNRGGPAQQNWNNRGGPTQQNWNNRGGPAQQNWNGGGQAPYETQNSQDIGNQQSFNQGGPQDQQGGNRFSNPQGGYDQGVNPSNNHPSQGSHQINNPSAQSPSEEFQIVSQDRNQELPLEEGPQNNKKAQNDGKEQTSLKTDDISLQNTEQGTKDHTPDHTHPVTKPTKVDDDSKMNSQGDHLRDDKDGHKEQQDTNNDEGVGNIQPGDDEDNPPFIVDGDHPTKGSHEQDGEAPEVGDIQPGDDEDNLPFIVDGDHHQPGHDVEDIDLGDGQQPDVQEQIDDIIKNDKQTHYVMDDDNDVYPLDPLSDQQQQAVVDQHAVEESTNMKTEQGKTKNHHTNNDKAKIISTVDIKKSTGHSSWHFISIFLFIGVVAVVGYFLLHNRKKLREGVSGYTSSNGRKRRMRDYQPLSHQ